MHGVATGLQGGLDDPVGAQVALGGERRTEHDHLVGHLRGERLGVGFGDADHGLDAEAAAGADHAHGDLAAVGHEHAADVVLGHGDGNGLAHGQASCAGLISNTIWSCCTGLPFSTTMRSTVPVTPALTVLNIFMTSTRHTVSSACTLLPTATKGG